MLFRVLNSPVSLIGSVHTLPADELTVPVPDLLAFDAASVAYFESDLDRRDAPTLGIFADGQTIADTVAEPTLGMATAAWSVVAPGSDFPELYKPWFLALQLAFRRTGCDPEHGVDKQLWRRALERGMRREVLEDRDDVMRRFDSAPAYEQERFLKFMAGTEYDFDEMYAAWRGSDCETLERLQKKRHAAGPVMFDNALAGRNREWLPSLLSAIEARRSAVFVVGVFHLIGPGSLPHLLGERGVRCNLVG